MKSSTLLSAAALLQSASAGVWLAGVNIAGFDFGCGYTNGSYYPNSVYAPLAALGHPDGVGQMQHFVNDDHLNVFRLPVCWQYLVNNVPGGTLDANAIGTYDELVGACLATGAYCVIDIHNYARWDNEIIGQSAITQANFASLWYQIAAKYAGQPKVIFGVMNEPHDVDVPTWATTVQWAVTSIRQAGATSQMILLPGTGYTAAGTFVSTGSAAALSAVKNLDGTTTNLIYDVHQYIDSDYSGTHSDCVYNGVSGLQTLATYLRSVGRQAFLTETGGGSTSSCYTDLCAELDWMNYNGDVYLGWIGWAAGSFDTSYVLSETPTYSNGVWYDTGIVSSCVAGKFAA